MTDEKLDSNNPIVQDAFRRVCEGVATWQDMQVMGHCEDLPREIRKLFLKRMVRMQQEIEKAREVFARERLFDRVYAVDPFASPVR